MKLTKFMYSWSGRIGVKGFLFGWLVNIAVVALIYYFHPYLPAFSKTVVLGVTGASVMFSLLSLVTRRYHDLNEKLPVGIVVVDIPVVSGIRDLMEFFRLFTSPGNPRANTYGKPSKF